jgi:hypothetical protein
VPTDEELAEGGKPCGSALLADLGQRDDDRLGNGSQCPGFFGDVQQREPALFKLIQVFIEKRLDETFLGSEVIVHRRDIGARCRHDGTQ